MWRALSVLLCLLSMSLLARAELTHPALLQLANNYRPSVARELRDLPPAELVARLNQARKAADVGRVLELSEALVAHDEANSLSWLNLAKAWSHASQSARSGLAAAIRASLLADTAADRLEAMLVASSVLRSSLERARSRFDSSNKDIATARLAISQTLESQTVEEDVVRSSAEERVKALQIMLENAQLASFQAAADIEQIVGQLDAIYREIAAFVPNLDASELRQGDARPFFDIALNEKEEPSVSYVYEAAGIRSCINFTKQLRQGSQDYESVVSLKEVEADEKPIGQYDLLADGKRLCFLGLSPGKSFEATVGAELSADDGTQLGKTRTAVLEVPDLPSRVGFSDGELILPSNGRGEISLSLTNIDALPLALHRISDRSIHRHLALGHVRNGLPSAEYQTLLTDFSEVLWQGIVEAGPTDEEKNKPVDLKVPVLSLLSDRADWIQTLDQLRGDRTGQVRSPTRGVSNAEKVGRSLVGSFVAGTVDINRDTAGQFVPGVYALVAPIPPPADSDEEECETGKCATYAAQWFVVSDIGLTFYEGERGFEILARSLRDGGPVVGANVQLISRGNRLLGEQVTNDNGVAHFSRSLTLGEGSNALLAVMADTGSDFSFIQYGSDRLDLSRLNVGSARNNQESALLYTSRGIYRPGETIEVLTLLRDRKKPIQNAELRLQIVDYIVAKLAIRPEEWKAGGGLLKIEVPPSAREGPATLKLVSAANDVLAEIDVQLGQIKPDRAKVEFFEDPERKLKATVADDGAVNISGRIRARYLYGLEGTDQGVAANLKAEVAVRIGPTSTPVKGCFGEFAFGQIDEVTLPMLQRDFVDVTDAEGYLSRPMIAVATPESSKPLAANVEVTLFDAAGPLASGQSSVSLPPRDVAIGISSTPRLIAEAGGYTLGLEVVAVDPNGAPWSERGLELLVKRERQSYAWQHTNGEWRHISTRSSETIVTKQIGLDGSSRDYRSDRCARPVTVDKVADRLAEGSYIVEVVDRLSGASSSIRFRTGSAQTTVDDLEPNVFVLASNKPLYQPGEGITLTVEAPFEEGKFLVAVGGRDIVAWFPGEVANGRGTITFQADPAWANQGLYALATAFKGVSTVDVKPGPARAIGATYFEVARNAMSFDIGLERESDVAFVRPDEALTFDVCLRSRAGICDQGNNTSAYAVAFVVDEGLLNLTGHEKVAESLRADLIGKSPLSLRIMDNYGRILAAGGGDQPGRLALTNYNSPKIVSMAQGPVPIVNGRASFDFGSLGLIAGAVKIHAIVWSPDNVANVITPLAVRNGLVSNLGLPAYFIAGDRPLLPLHLENVDFGSTSARFALKFGTKGGVKVDLLTSAGTRKERLSDGSFLLSVPVGAPLDLLLALDLSEAAIGGHEMSLDVSLPEDVNALPPGERRRIWTFNVQPTSNLVRRYVDFDLNATGQKIVPLVEEVIGSGIERDSLKMVARFSAANDSLEMASVDQGPGEPGAILDRLVWSGMIDLADRRRRPSVRSRIQAAIENIQAMQTTYGSFVPYRTDRDFTPSEVNFDMDESLDGFRRGMVRNVSALDFLLRARRAGFAVSEQAIENSMTFARTWLDNAIAASDSDAGPDRLCSFATRFAVLILAHENRVVDSDLAAIERCDVSADTNESEDTGITTESLEEAELDGREPETNGRVASPRILNLLATDAAYVEFGEPRDVDKTLEIYYGGRGEYLGDLTDYQKAIAISLLMQAEGDERQISSLAASFIRSGEGPDLRTRAWLARAVSDMGDRGSDQLTLADLEIDPPGALALSNRGPGVIESSELKYLDLQGQEIVVRQVGGPPARGLLRISGRPTEPNASALVEADFRRRFFRIENGREVDLFGQQLEVGTRLVMVVEGTARALSTFRELSHGDISPSFGPIAVSVSLPAAMTLVADSLASIERKADLAKLAILGDLRSIDTNPQEWKGVVVPLNRGDSGESDFSDDDIVFRQAFVVALITAGTFQFPAMTIDPLEFPYNTVVGRQAEFTVAVPMERGG